MSRNEIIAKNIRKRRKEKGYSQQTLADKIGLYSQKQLSRYERGEVKRLTQEFLELVARALDTTAKALEDEEYVKM